MTKESIDIFLICDYSIFRTALRMLIESEDRLNVVGEASIAKLSPDMILKTSPDLILCDLSTFGEKALLELITPETEDIPILVITRNNEIEFYQHCLKLGIKGLVSKQNGVDVLYKAIEKVCDGEFWFDRSIMAETIQHMINEKQSIADNPAVQKLNGMTDREKQVIELICKGLKNKGIAEKLFITETTVRHHLTSVFNKLEVASRLELVIYAFKNKLVKLPTNHTNFETNGVDSRSAYSVGA
ncbi:MAG: LuxR C-terminal-related transcriptional regulator [Pyrinomonadaceae bacterium]